MDVTQKLHGTNAQIYIQDQEVKAGSRNRWLSLDDDNYGFARFVDEHKSSIIELLGDGRHFGEWCGPGINSGEGLTEKRLLLFDFRRWVGKPLPSRIGIVPLIYSGALHTAKIDEIMDELKRNGSYLVPGFMQPEGIVVTLGNKLYKQVFEQEDSAWAKVEKVRPSQTGISVDHLLQPLRLHKLLSRDEQYKKHYPLSLPAICRDYVQDLIAEKELDPSDDMLKRLLSRRVYPFVKTIMGNVA